MTELNSLPPVKITNVMKGRKTFDIDVDTTGFGKHVHGGIVTEKRMAQFLNFRPLSACLVDPGTLEDVDGSKASNSAVTYGEAALQYFGQPEFNKKFGRSGLLHLANLALYEFQARHKSLPEPNNPAQVEEFLLIVHEINNSATENNKVEELDESRIAALSAIASGARSVLSPMAAIFGGLVGQEVVKAATNKYSPTFQWFYFDALECAPARSADKNEYAPTGSRYDDQIAVFGKQYQETLSKLNLFLVGCGALGCEFLKNFAMMGISAGGSGHLTVTDDDIIEKSNLSRQFLFRNHNVGKSKSACGANAVKEMNPAFSITPLTDRVAPTTEAQFDDNFWINTNIVVNALDNVKARMYVDERCVLYGKPLFESGTLGTKCNVQVVIPGQTENYGASADPPEKEAPQCAIHNFPHNIDHCLGLARSEFVGLYESIPNDTNALLENGAGAIEEWKAAQENAETIMDKLCGDPKTNCGVDGGIRDLIVSATPSSFNDCVAWARNKFESYFVNRIKQLIHNFPKDSTTESGALFWSPPKRFPTVVEFNADDHIHMQFIIAASNLRANIFRLDIPKGNRDPAYFKPILTQVAVPAFTPFVDVTIKVSLRALSKLRFILFYHRRTTMRPTRHVVRRHPWSIARLSSRV